MLTSRLYGGWFVTSEPPRYTRPAVGFSNPPIMRSVVVLPHPEGPSMAKKFPRGIDSVRSSTAVMSAKRFVTPSRWMSASACEPVNPRSFRLTIAHPSAYGGPPQWTVGRIFRNDA